MEIEKQINLNSWVFDIPVISKETSTIIKIFNCSVSGSWYENYIGMFFPIDTHTYFKEVYLLDIAFLEDTLILAVLKKDCEIVSYPKSVVIKSRYDLIKERK
jgi:hypothetical protein